MTTLSKNGIDIVKKQGKAWSESRAKRFEDSEVDSLSGLCQQMTFEKKFVATKTMNLPGSINALITPYSSLNKTKEEQVTDKHRQVWKEYATQSGKAIEEVLASVPPATQRAMVDACKLMAPNVCFPVYERGIVKHGRRKVVEDTIRNAAFEKASSDARSLSKSIRALHDARNDANKKFNEKNKMAPVDLVDDLDLL